MPCCFYTPLVTAATFFWFLVYQPVFTPLLAQNAKFEYHEVCYKYTCCKCSSETHYTSTPILLTGNATGMIRGCTPGTAMWHIQQFITLEGRLGVTIWYDGDRLVPSGVHLSDDIDYHNEWTKDWKVSEYDTEKTYYEVMYRVPKFQ